MDERLTDISRTLSHALRHDPENLTSVFSKGLLPRGRQQVHMATGIETARSVGSRHATRPANLWIDAAAHEAGIRFHPGSDRVWMAGTIPAQYLSEL